MNIQNKWIQAESERIMSNPHLLANAFSRYCAIHPTKCGQALRNASSGTVGDMLALDDLLRKAAEVDADSMWCDWRAAA